jgi:transposase InsO family protein
MKKRFVTTTDGSHHNGIYPNLLKGRILSRINEAWVADITYIHLPGGFCYLATVLDAFSRRCVGWHLSQDTTPFVSGSTVMSGSTGSGITRASPVGGSGRVIHHSDRGVQYTSGKLHRAATRRRDSASMSAKGNPYDNAKAESFFKTLKQEEVYLNEYRTFTEAQENIDTFIGAVYNKRRLHSSLGYKSPVTFEEASQEGIAKSSLLPKLTEPVSGQRVHSITYLRFRFQ